MTLSEEDANSDLYEYRKVPDFLEKFGNLKLQLTDILLDIVAWKRNYLYETIRRKTRNISFYIKIDKIKYTPTSQNVY